VRISLNGRLHPALCAKAWMYNNYQPRHGCAGATPIA